MPYSLEHLQLFHRLLPPESTTSPSQSHPTIPTDRSAMPFQRIALIGANGTLGPAILSALLNANFTITVLTRQSSKSTYPPEAHTSPLPDALPTEDLVAALTGQDALITTFAGSNADLQIRLADACVTAGVKRFIPADFGSCDSENPRAIELMPFYAAKKQVREHLQELAAQGTLSWTSIVCGHFFDWGLRGALLSFNLENRTARVYDGGDIRWSTSTLGRVGESVVRVLQKEEETRDRACFVQSFCVSQNAVLGCLERVTGEKWEVERVGSEDFIREMKGRLDKDPGDGDAMGALVSVAGIVESNWEGKDGFANELLGLKEEGLEEVVRGVVEGS